MTAARPKTRRRFPPTLAQCPTVDQYLLLSMLLHVLAILLFGDTKGENTRAGFRPWGSINISMRPLDSIRTSEVSPPRRPADAESKPRTEPRPPPAQPQARTTLPVVKTEATTATSQTPAPEAAAAEPESVQPEAEVQATIPSTRLSPVEAPRFIAIDVQKATTEFVVPPASTTATSKTVTNSEANALPSEARVVPPRLEPMAPVTIENEVARPVQPKLRQERPVLPTLAPVAPMIAAPKFDREVAPPVTELPRLAPLTTPSASIAPTVKMDRGYVPPAQVEALPQLAPITAPAAPLAPAAQIDQTFVAPRTEPLQKLAPIAPAAAQESMPATPARIEREFVPPSIEFGTRTVLPEGNKTGDVIRPEARATPAAKAVTPSASAADAGNSPETVDKSLSRPGGLVDSINSGRDALPGSVPPAGKAPLDLDALRQRARELSQGSGPRTVFPFPTAPKPPAKTSAQEAFDKALKRPDCKDAYAEMGLAAVVPLIRDAVTAKGCKW